MRADSEHSPASRKASNRLHALLRLAATSCGAERAFLAQTADAGDGTEPRVVAVSTARDDGSRVTSRSVIRRALAGPRPMLLLHVVAPLASAASVRGLGLRSIVSMPVALPRPARAAMVLDSRDGFRLPAADLQTTLEAFADLVALVCPQPTPQPAERGERVDAPPLQRGLLSSVQRIARTSLPVLIQGESGSGKEGVSRALHRLGPRHAGPFVAINCTAVTESLLDAELFGAVRGAYTGLDRDRPGLFCQAHGGTLFLDEVGDMPRAMQAKLLRALESGRVRPVGGASETETDVRVVAATHRDLRQWVARGRYRADLYYRLSVLRIDVPPLRSRLDELPELVAELTPRLTRETGYPALGLAADAWPALAAHHWPGNVRELHGTLARAMLRAEGGEIRERHLELPPALPVTRVSGGSVLEREMIENALEQGYGSISAAATRIGWSRQKLYRRIRALGLERPGAVGLTN